MAKGKSKEFMLKRGRWSSILSLRYLGNHLHIAGFCSKAFQRYFGIKIREGEKKRIRITIEEIK